LDTWRNPNEDIHNLMGGSFAQELRTFETYDVDLLDRWKVGMDVFFRVYENPDIVTEDFWTAFRDLVRSFMHQSSRMPTWTESLALDRYWENWKLITGYGTSDAFLLMNLPGEDYAAFDIKALDKRIEVDAIITLVGDGVPVGMIAHALDNGIDYELIRSLTTE